MAPPPPKKPPAPRLPSQKFAIATLDQIFDVQFVAKYNTPARPVGLEEDPETLHKLIKCANLAIWDYNSQHKTDYRFLNIQMATWQLAPANIFNITFKCKNAKKENQYTSFQATVYHTKHTRNVKRIRIKESTSLHCFSFFQYVSLHLRLFHT
ncbi:hypothetical protein P8452_18939 [Trifolium repens]|nr:hypothetical protein P8452_18939 [Trifolium repens]